MTRGGGGVKNQDFYGDILFEWPLSKFSIVEYEVVKESFGEKNII